MELQTRRNWTRQWLFLFQKDAELVTSAPVLEELKRTPSPKREKVLSLIEDLPVLDYPEEIDEIIDVYISHKLMPANALGDAAHLALASYHKCDYLVTWNCKHIANANKFNHIRRVNSAIGLYCPILTTPLELLGQDNDSE
ncbi:MAG: type II toxin-antitoxin system VapC family toxin [Verrucomicrobiota bacterium]